MGFFGTIKMNLAICLYYPNQIRIYDMKRLVVSFVGFLVVISFFAFLFYEAEDMAEYVTSAYFCTTMLGIFLSFLHTTTETATIFVLINEDVAAMIQKRLKYPASKAIYIKTHRLVEKLCKIMYFVVVKMTPSGFAVPKAILCFIIYLTTDTGSKAFELPLPMWFPFDYKSPFGYLIAILLEFLTLFFASRYLACFLTLAFGTFMFELSFAKDMVAQVHSINKWAKAKKSEKFIQKRLIELIVMHADMRQLLNDFTKVYQPTVAILVSGSSVAICSSMLLFQVNISSDEVNTVVILVSFVYGFWAIVMLLFTCETGQRLTYEFIQFDSEISQLDWNFLPSKVQRLLPIILINTQEPMYIECFGSIQCCRETFKSVANSGYTFFMMLRKMYG